MKKEKGVALIVVLVMVLIFSSLILAVVLASSSAIRRANYNRDKFIAYQIAEAGIQDCLFWMNYKGYQNYSGYPCSKWNGTTSKWEYNPDYIYFRGSNWGDGTNTDTWTNTEPTNYNPTDITGGRCVLSFEDKDDPDMDTITSIGYYKGRTATITVRIRGSNGRGNTNHNEGGRYLRDYDESGHTDTATWGIPEALNKHVIYARSVDGTGATSLKIGGNVFTSSITSLTQSETCTVTQTTDLSYFNEFAIPESSLSNIPSKLNPPPSDEYTYYLHRGTAYLSPFDGTNTDTYFYYPSDPASGIQYDTTLDLHTFTDTNLAYSYYVHARKDGAPSNGNVRFSSSSNNGVTITKQIGADGDITILGDTTSSDTDLVVSGNGCLIVADTKNFYLGGNGNTINIRGNLILYKSSTGTITFNSIYVPDPIKIEQGSLIILASTFAIDNTSDTIEIDSGILVKNHDSGDTTFTLNFPSTAPNLKINGPVPGSGTCFMVYSPNGNATFNIATSNNVDLSNVNCEGKALVAVYALGTGPLKTGTITIGSATTCPLNIKPSVIYCYGTDTTNTKINIYNDNTQIKGALWCNGTVDINNNSKIYWSSQLLNSTYLPSKFKGGRRVYLPVLGSWQVRW